MIENSKCISDHLGVSAQIWKSQLSRERKGQTGTLSQSLLEPFRNFRMRLSRQNQKRVQIQRTLPWGIVRAAFSFPYLQIERPLYPTTPIFYSQPPKKELFLTFPASLASLSTCSLMPVLILGTWTGFLPMSCSLRVTILAKMKQYWSRQSRSFIFLGLAARKTSSSLTVSLILREPVGVDWMIILALLMSQIGITRSPICSEFSLNSSQRSIQMLAPFFEGISTSYLSLASFLSECLSFNLTEARSAPLPYFSLLAGSSRDDTPNWFSSSLKGCLGERSILASGSTRVLGWTGTDSSSEEELLPKSSFLLMMASCLYASRQFLYLSLSALKSASGLGEFWEESVLLPSRLWLALMRKGCFLAGGSSSELESCASFLAMICASLFLASLSARQSCLCLLKSLSAGAFCVSSAKLKPVFSCMWIYLTPDKYNYIMNYCAAIPIPTSPTTFFAFFE